jgi:chorismate mutase
MLAQEAMDLNFDGLMIETHCYPECALSDSRQQVTPAELFIILDKLVHRSSKEECGEITRYRALLDEIDGELMRLITKRMQIAREIGEIKREKGLTVFQPFRYNEAMERFATEGALRSLDVEAMKDIFEVIHTESIRQQLRIVNENI